MAVGALVKGPLVDRALGSGHQHLQSRARDLATKLQVQGREVRVGMKRERFAPIDVFAGAASRDRVNQDHAVGLNELLEVVGDMRKGVFLVAFEVESGWQQPPAQEPDRTQVFHAERFLVELVLLKAGFPEATGRG
ncbi:MAG: hypothetical protein E6G51_06015 [Actinobacteria bacterium]|nr:MAG: hypothetical protein E6G51_06015 [Actinomycetota bacterium]